MIYPTEYFVTCYQNFSSPNKLITGTLANRLIAAIRIRPTLFVPANIALYWRQSISCTPAALSRSLAVGSPALDSHSLGPHQHSKPTHTLTQREASQSARQTARPGHPVSGRAGAALWAGQSVSQSVSETQLVGRQSVRIRQPVESNRSASATYQFRCW